MEASDASAVSSAAAPSYGWLEIPAAANYTPAWSSINYQWRRRRRSSSSYDEDDSSIFNATPYGTNACGHSGLSMKSSSELSGEPPENNLWNQAILNAAGRGDTLTHRDGGESFLQMHHPKSAKADQFLDPAADLLKKQDSSWEHADPLPPSSLERQFANFHESTGRLIASISLSELVSNWSVSSSIPRPSTCGALTPSMARCSSSNVALERQETGYQIGLNSISALLPSCSSARSLPDFISFSGCSNRSTGDLRPSDMAESRRPGYDHSSGTGNGRCPGTAAGRKRRSSDNSETPAKKSKQENSAASSYQAPKVKVLDKINALHQLVSPFGKTDTTSVLFETINCIKFLQEQVQLLCDTYIKSVGCKVGCSWGEMEKKEKSESMLDLRSKGLCLIPTSCVPQIHQENCCPDYWMPAYPTCLYR